MTATSMHRDVQQILATGDLPRAAAACERLNVQFPKYAPGWVTGSGIALRLGRPQLALERIEVAVSLVKAEPAILIHKAHCLIALHQRDEAVSIADAVRGSIGHDPAALDALGTIYSLTKEYTRALESYGAAVALAPGSPRYYFNRATVRRFLGDLQGAEQDYNRVIALDPEDYEAYKNRSDLRTQTADRNHTTELGRLLDRPIPDWRGEVQVRYAMAKELEDLGEHQRSFAHLDRAARLRRRHSQYDVKADVATVDWIIEAFPTAPERFSLGSASRGPIFIVGLPRSGTTMVERILGCHSLVDSAGELTHFAEAIVTAVTAKAGTRGIPRQQMIALSRTIDFDSLGKDYLRRAQPLIGAKPRFTDKMPLNYLYCGLIRRALPSAHVIHVTRHPMAACYAIYKTLFKDAYPFSYDLDDLANYYVGYRKLMAHWNSTMPGYIYEVKYERLVTEQLAESRHLLDYCDLAWEDACAEFHLSPLPTITASAAQVRRPVYRSSLAQWQHYEPQLEPLRQKLIALGISEAELRH